MPVRSSDLLVADIGAHISHPRHPDECETVLHGAGGVHAHGHTTFETVLQLPARHGTAFRHVLMNWNPGGHEPPGIYDVHSASDQQSLSGALYSEW